MSIPETRIPVLRARPSVTFNGLAPAGFRILAALDQATIALGVDLIITCGSDSHPPTDPHTTGEAIDVSVRDVSPATIAHLKSTLERILGPLFTVLYEVPTAPAPNSPLAAIATVSPVATGAHLHIQRKKNTIFPPPPTAAARPPV